jgi:hypothetical protein
MKMLIILFLSLITFPALAPGYKSIYLERPEAIRDDRLLLAIIKIESNGDPSVINWKEQAMGLLQIRPCMLKEVNRIVGYEKYSTKDCLDSLKSIEMYQLIQSRYNPTNDFKTGAILWNGKSKLNLYWKKVKAII